VTPYAELDVTSNFTFLTGASKPEELVQRAAELGYRAFGVADTNSLAGVVRAHVAAKEAGLAFAVGCRLRFELDSDTPELLVYATDRASYGRLCRLLTIGKRRAPKGQCHLGVDDLIEHSAGLVGIVQPPGPPGEPAALDERFARALRAYRRVFDGDRLSLAATALFGPDDAGWLARLADLARYTQVPLMATGGVHYHEPSRRTLQDLLVCIREGCTLDEAGLALFPNGERYMKAPDEVARLFAAVPGALERSALVAERAAHFSLDEIRYQYPDEICPAGRSPMEYLAELTREGAHGRYPDGVPEKVERLIAHELRLIEELDYAPYFLTVYDLVRYARSVGILCHGRGAAANSAVCFCLGVTAVDPDRIDLLFERFVSKERDEPPDIDIDFEHERREEVIQYIYGKYGRERAALTAEVISYRARSAVRDVGKALGLSLDCIDRLAKDLDWWGKEVQGERLSEMGLDPEEPTMQRLIAHVGAIQGFPRHLSQHVGGFVMTKGPLCELVPIENAAMPDRTVIEWDKDDIEAMGMLKVDVLGLGMLTCVRKAFELINERLAVHLDLHTIPPEDPAVYDMICEADTVGVFQIESRAQMSMLPRLRPRNYYDLVIEVAIVRPGPIQGNMVHPYLRRRNGEERVSYPSDEVRGVLARTLGVPLFQEQVMALAVVAGGFSAGKADELRRAMAAWKRKSDTLANLGEELILGLIGNGYEPEFAKRLFDQILGFGEYGFPESHAASFALIVYVSAWLKKHHPAAFAAALINSQPMGFYAPAQIVRDAREHGVDVRPVDVNCSTWDCTLEDTVDGEPALRLGMRLVKGLRSTDADAISTAVSSLGTFGDIDSLHQTSGARAVALRHLAKADAFASMGLDRQRALWSVRALRDTTQGSLWLPPVEKAAPRLPDVSPIDRVLSDYASMTLSLKAHPMSFARRRLEERNVVPAGDLRDEDLSPNGMPVTTAGVVLVRQRPQTAKGLFFMTLEDETGISNLVVPPDVFDRDRAAARHATVVLAHGRVERAGNVVHVKTNKIESLDSLVGELLTVHRHFH
jgi:error-prone DNA polymerase